MTFYPLAKQGVFRTIQGEGGLLGTPMVFVRLAGCSVGCDGCDTDYRVASRASAIEIAQQVKAMGPCAWTWVTGGEPADHDLRHLLEELRLCGRVALATSGHKSLRGVENLLDFLSVSPHGKPSDLVIQSAGQINLVPGLNGLKLSDWEDYKPHSLTFLGSAWVTPCDGKPETLAECVDFVQRHQRRWRLGVQAHKTWGIA